VQTTDHITRRSSRSVCIRESIAQRAAVRRPNDSNIGTDVNGKGQPRVRESYEKLRERQERSYMARLGRWERVSQSPRVGGRVSSSCECLGDPHPSHSAKSRPMPLAADVVGGSASNASGRRRRRRFPGSSFGHYPRTEKRNVASLDHHREV
jgi:hypothetical protein